MPVNPVNTREEAFCAAYVSDPKRNGAAAAIAAGYARRSAKVTASRKLTQANVRARIAELEQVARERAKMNFESIIDAYTAIVRADPNDLMAVEVGACRYCHGIDHDFQWRSKTEFKRAVAAWEDLPENKRRRTLPPSKAGGFGFTRHRAPNPECPECDGDGVPKIVVRDTRCDHPLFAGVKCTRYGVEIRLHDKMAALEALGRIFGVFDRDNRPKDHGDDLGAYLVRRINSGQAQGIILNRGTEPEVDGET